MRVKTPGLLALFLLLILCCSADPQPAARLAIGERGPDFELASLEGKALKLSELGKDKIVVLEWYSPACPISLAYHYPPRSGGAGLLSATYESLKGDDLIWLAINSEELNEDGNSFEDNLRFCRESGVAYPMLLDSDAAVAKAYGARKTPDIFILNREGKLAYSGAVDEGESADYPAGHNHIEEAVKALRAGIKPEPAETEPFGCGI